MRCSIVGMGKLGSSLLAVLSTKHDVIGVDVNKTVIEAINYGQPPVAEPGLAELLIANRDRYWATGNMTAAADTDITFIIVPTPSGADGAFENTFVITAVSAVGAAIKTKTTPHIVVITSTVMPGSTLGPIAAALTANAAKPLGPDLAILYQPEFIALGSVVQDMSNPDMFLIGASDTHAGDVLEELLKSVAMNDPPVARLTIPEAEIAKLCVNCFVTTKLSAANTLAELCETIPDTDATRVAAAIGLDTRIGGKYLQPATAFAGPCLPRDNDAFVALCKKHELRAPIAEATICVNDRQMDRLANLVESVTPPYNSVGVLGLAYKPHTPVIDRSVGVALAEELARRRYRVFVHDPLAEDNLRSRFDGTEVHVSETALSVVMESRTIVVAQPCEEYRCLHHMFTDRTIVDVWNLYHDPTYLRPGVYQWGMP